MVGVDSKQIDRRRSERSSIVCPSVLCVFMMFTLLLAMFPDGHKYVAISSSGFRCAKNLVIFDRFDSVGL